MNGLIRIGLIVGIAIAGGFVIYVIVAGLILLHHVVPIWWLPIFVLAALILTVLYDEFGPHGE